MSFSSFKCRRLDFSEKVSDDVLSCHSGIQYTPARNGNHMASWVLICTYCGTTFLHSRIQPTVMEEFYRDPYRVVTRPRVMKGERFPCPQCNVESPCQQFHLIYSEDYDAAALASA
jgi:hypothetical protein